MAIKVKETDRYRFGQLQRLGDENGARIHGRQDNEDERGQTDLKYEMRLKSTGQQLSIR